MKLINVVEKADDGKHLRRKLPIQGVMVHRCGIQGDPPKVILGFDGPSVINEFLGKGKYPEVAKVTGGQNAYSFLIGGNQGPPHLDGIVWQALPLMEVGFHARRFSFPYVGVGLILDGRFRPPSSKQYASLIELCGLLCEGLGVSSRFVIGHGERQGAHDGSKAPGMPNACPGDLVVMDRVRYDVQRFLNDAPRRHLLDSGIVVDWPLKGVV